jgi:medium-chain acyl-[acyl-carrier-protein] hydrolase
MSTMTSTSSAASTRSLEQWVPFRVVRPHPRLRLFCFPYAGGAAQVFRLWGSSLSEEVEVCPIQLPGRWNRLKEPPFTRVEPLVEAAAAALRPLLDLPFAFFGHSFGALVAFELVRQLRREGGPLPIRLFLAARRAPQVPLNRQPIHALPDEPFLAAMQKIYNGIPKELLENRDLLELLLPAIRADMQAYEHYTYTAEPPLEIPLTVYGGRTDASATEDDLQEWRHQTGAPFKVIVFPGNHFFLLTATAQLLETLAEELRG